MIININKIINKIINNNNNNKFIFNYDYFYNFLFLILIIFYIMEINQKIK